MQQMRPGRMLQCTANIDKKPMLVLLHENDFEAAPRYLNAAMSVPFSCSMSMLTTDMQSVSSTQWIVTTARQR